MIKFINSYLSIAVILIFSGMISLVYAEEKALWATSRYAADIIFVVVDDHDAPKWYIGECSGDITMRSDRIKLYESDYKGSSIQEVQLVDEKYYADRVFCVK